MERSIEYAVTFQIGTPSLRRCLRRPRGWFYKFSHSLPWSPPPSVASTSFRCYSFRAPPLIPYLPPSSSLICMSHRAPLSSCSSRSPDDTSSPRVFSCRPTSAIVASNRLTCRTSLPIYRTVHTSPRGPLQFLPNCSFLAQSGSSIVSLSALWSSSTVPRWHHQGSGKPSITFVGSYVHQSSLLPICFLAPCLHGLRQTSFSPMSCDRAYRFFCSACGVNPFMAASGSTTSLWGTNAVPDSVSLSPSLGDTADANDCSSSVPSRVQKAPHHPEECTCHCVIPSLPAPVHFHSLPLFKISYCFCRPCSPSMTLQNHFSRFPCFSAALHTSRSPDAKCCPINCWFAHLARRSHCVENPPVTNFISTTGACAPYWKFFHRFTHIPKRYGTAVSPLCTTSFQKTALKISNTAGTSTSAAAPIAIQFCPDNKFFQNYCCDTTAEGQAPDDSLTQKTAIDAVEGVSEVFSSMQKKNEHIRFVYNLYPSPPLYLVGIAGLGLLTVLYLRPRKKGMRIDRRKYVYYKPVPRAFCQE